MQHDHKELSYGHEEHRAGRRAEESPQRLSPTRASRRDRHGARPRHADRPAHAAGHRAGGAHRSSTRPRCAQTGRRPAPPTPPPEKRRAGTAAGGARRAVIAYIESSVVLRLVLGQPGALREWRSLDGGVASALVEVECLRTLDRLRLAEGLRENELARRRETVYRVLETLEVV